MLHEAVLKPATWLTSVMPQPCLTQLSVHMSSIILLSQNSRLLPDELCCLLHVLSHCLYAVHPKE